jgi:heme oxygenase
MVFAVIIGRAIRKSFLAKDIVSRKPRPLQWKDTTARYDIILQDLKEKGNAIRNQKK